MVWSLLVKAFAEGTWLISCSLHLGTSAASVTPHHGWASCSTFSASCEACAGFQPGVVGFLSKQAKGSFPRTVGLKVLPGPPKYVKSWPFRLFLVAWGYYFTYFTYYWGPSLVDVTKPRTLLCLEPGPSELRREVPLRLHFLRPVRPKPRDLRRIAVKRSLPLRFQGIPHNSS